MEIWTDLLVDARLQHKHARTVTGKSREGQAII
jgi:hypothetical protein